ncbi:NAD(P)/FAD-dependent oxidoreductase [Flavihumibacter solisilvae]|uniref:FAD dependent oxidoreductase domain-containing protein n=1 Tax=Flavihumibacter solisilvae TaxID=1349421 RepID=A0A0C1KSP1_9BACT|nr:FAD-dependent oxidoreductase [Flavihumibacter solisilvae]KIC90717.1 hypothetical protein OI18_22725 [Flavihumibacter solisilvae]
MQVNTIIIGQGLCGTWLSKWLTDMGQQVMVIDESKPVTSSKIASGVINPVTGRVLARTWMAGQLLPFALEAYEQFGQQLDINCIRTVDILHSFPTAQMREAFDKRLPEIPEYLTYPENEEKWKKLMEIPFGLGSIHPALLIDLNLLLNEWQKRLSRDRSLLQETFDLSALSLKNGLVSYKDVKAERVIFCDGIGSLHLPFFNRLPFSPNKGEALLLEIEELPASHIYKRGLSVVPFPHFNSAADDRYFWAGSTYENRFKDEQPTAAFRTRTEQVLRDWLKVPFRVVDHWAAIRPATVERRPFAGMHPVYPQLGILNGTGTKGCSLAPWFAKQLADQIVHGTPIQPEASVARFSGILSA